MNARQYLLAHFAFLLLSSPDPACAQYMYLDVNGDGLNTSADVLTSASTGVDVWLSTNANADSSTAVCNSSGAALTINSYEFFLRSAGSVTYGAWIDSMGFSTNLGDLVSGTDTYHGRFSLTVLSPGTYKLGRLALTGVIEGAILSIVPSSLVNPPGFTSFGSGCEGNDSDNTLKLGVDWHDTGGLSPPILPGFLREGVPHMMGQATVENSSASSSPVDSGCPQSAVACDFTNKPSVAAFAGCAGPPPFASRDTITYFFQNAFGPIPNCDINVEVRSDFASGTNTGGHCHNETDRPVGTYAPASGNSGADGLQFKVVHEWPEVAGRYHVVVSTVPGGPCGTASGIYTACIRKENSFASGMMALVDGRGYVRTGGPDNITRHPDHHYGTAKFIEALRAVAAQFSDSVAGAPLLGFNDMSLRWGGVFDIDTTSVWHPSHCGHRFGTNCDMRTHAAGAGDSRVPVYTNDQLRLLTRLFKRHGVFPYVHGPNGPVFPHWHLQPLVAGGLQ